MRPRPGCTETKTLRRQRRRSAETETKSETETETDNCIFPTAALLQLKRRKRSFFVPHRDSFARTRAARCRPVAPRPPDRGSRRTSAADVPPTYNRTARRDHGRARCSTDETYVCGNNPRLLATMLVGQMVLVERRPVWLEGLEEMAKARARVIRQGTQETSYRKPPGTTELL